MEEIRLINVLHVTLPIFGKIKCLWDLDVHANLLILMTTYLNANLVIIPALLAQELPVTNAQVVIQVVQTDPLLVLPY
jgi:hypothetical protein